MDMSTPDTSPSPRVLWFYDQLSETAKDIVIHASPSRVGRGYVDDEIMLRGTTPGIDKDPEFLQEVVAYAQAKALEYEAIFPQDFREMSVPRTTVELAELAEWTARSQPNRVS
jgi:hypothetical protein